LQDCLNLRNVPWCSIEVIWIDRILWTRLRFFGFGGELR
jgi:hypothetical protein